MTNSKNELVMRAAGEAYLTAGSSVVAILSALASNPDEAYINTLKFEFYLGGMLTVEPDEVKARAYIPDDNIKTIKKCAFSPFPSDKPESFDATKHRTQGAQRVFNQMKANWSNWREAAGLPSLKVTRAAQAPSGDKSAETEDAPKVTPKGLAVESGLDTAAIVSYVQAFETWLDGTLRTNAKHVRGDAGSLLSEVETTLRAYTVKLTDALASDAVPAPTIAEAKREADLKASNDALHAELAALKAQMTAPPAKRAKQVAKAA